MNLISEFDYELPKELIAQLPSKKRPDAKLMVLDRKMKTIKHNSVSQLDTLLQPNDLLVFNDAKVMPARLYGQKQTGGKVEVFLLEDKSKDGEIIWEVLVKPGLKVGTVLYFPLDLTGVVLEILDEGKRLVRFKAEGSFFDVLDKIGQIPLPPYIDYDESKTDYYKNRYQTVFANKLGAVAAPTAGLHFNEELLSSLKSRGVNTAFLTLYVGIGTFRPIKCDNYLEHKMHSENYELSKETVNLIDETKKKGGRVIAVGTTTTRVLEGVSQKYGTLEAGVGQTEIFIYPGFKFTVVDAMLTNFHLPKSSLLLMISAFADKQFIMQAYEEAIINKYRFFSFGDAMLIL